MHFLPQVERLLLLFVVKNPMFASDRACFFCATPCRISAV